MTEKIIKTKRPNVQSNPQKKIYTKGGIVPGGTFIPDINIVHTLNKTEKEYLIKLNLLKPE